MSEESGLQLADRWRFRLPHSTKEQKKNRFGIHLHFKLDRHPSWRRELLTVLLSPDLSSCLNLLVDV